VGVPAVEAAKLRSANFSRNVDDRKDALLLLPLHVDKLLLQVVLLVVVQGLHPPLVNGMDDRVLEVELVESQMKTLRTLPGNVISSLVDGQSVMKDDY